MLCDADGTSDVPFPVRSSGSFITTPHDDPGIGSILPALAKIARTGTHDFITGIKPADKNSRKSTFLGSVIKIWICSGEPVQARIGLERATMS